MLHRIQRLVIAVAVLGAIAVGSAVVANAASSGSSGSAGNSPTAATQQGAQGHPPRGHADETLLTGDTADNVTQAAKDEVPGGTVLRVETDAEGSPYEAHVRKSDGTEVTVKVDKAFKVTAVEEFGSGRTR